MDSSRFLIIGSNGQLGRALSEHYPAAQKVDQQELDITNEQSIEQYDWSSVDVILNAAAYTNVDGAETNEGRLLAWKINAQAISYLVRVAIKYNVTLVHISSEYVFDGTKAPHTEEEPFSPLGVYAQTKAAGDIVVHIAPKHYILRTSWVIGDGKNFVRTMMDVAKKDISPTVVNDQFGRLTFTTTLVDAIHHLITSKSSYGTYNISNSGQPVSWADVTRIIFQNMKRNDLEVFDTSSQEYFKSKQNIAPRPLNSELDLTKIESTGFHPKDWQTDLSLYVAHALE